MPPLTRPPNFSTFPGKSNLLSIASGPALRVPEPNRTPAEQSRQPASPPPAAKTAPQPNALYERALTCAAMEDLAGAVHALQQATALDPALTPAWVKLAEILAQTGHPDAAAQAEAAAQANTAHPSAPKPPRPRALAKLEAAERQLRATIQARRPDAIEPLLCQHLLDDPTDAPALLVLAQTLMNQGRADRAERLLARALDLAPAYTLARHLYAVTLFRQAKEAQAIAHIERLLAEHPRTIAYRTLLASSLAMTGQITRAIDIFQALIKEAPKEVDLWVSYAQALQHAGRRAESQAAFRTIISFAPATGQAHCGLQNLSTEPPTPEDLAAMRANLAGTALTPETRFHFEYALASALEKTGEYAESFAHYAAGAKLWRAQIAYNPEDTTQRVRRTKAVFSQAFLTTHANQGDPDPAPIFILGMPRAGSTLIEQILATHSAVEGTKELPELGHLVQELGPRRAAASTEPYSPLPYPECLLSLSPDALAAIGRRYIERTRLYRVTKRPYFIDKMPANWIDTGLIALILPNAKIIDARRSPMATCFAAFKQYFSAGQAFTYDLTELGRYYNDYADLMAHFDAVAPGRVHRAIYENIVTDTEAEIRRILDYCNLDFEPACLRFWETKRTVITASSQQVHRPIFREGLDQWRSYEPWLMPLKTSLGL